MSTEKDVLNSVKENKMGTMPINKLLISMSLPIIASMLVQALYNIVDSIFVAQINENALTAVSLAYPVQNLMIAIASGTGVGVNSFISKCLGAKDFKYANKAANVSIFLALMNWLILIIIGLTLSRWFFTVQTDNPEIIEYGYEYLSIVSVFSVGVFGQIMGERLLQSTGKTMYTMITQGIGAIINIIFDPILIFGLLGFPELGVSGAAIATVMGQIVAMLLAVFFNIKFNKELKFDLKKILPEKHIVASIYKVGLPSVLMIAISSVTTFAMNKILIAFTSTATAVYGVYFKLNSFIFMPIFGLNNGMVPILAYNYGAEKYSRVLKTMRLSIIYAISIMLIGLLIFQIFPEQLLMMFNASEEMISIGVPALRIISISFLAAGFCIVTLSVFQALGQGMYSLITSVSRQLVVLVPVAYVLSLLGELELIWWSMPIAEIISVALCIIFIKMTFKRLNIPLSSKGAA
ncbi:MAG TPA: MATE family efflux transporter [Candidatus Monoglobus merdigallinarum]|uniref:Probable multidrug resistance protein NorM n=1 Tax=Candidatus Monoglobus merdigallinarum TaxID=2838698 RepID=A0A9D1TLT5_9FIRM|nr:MATE family efflux transporter [Candidatus Monoglobus merdigallinarum]